MSVNPVYASGVSFKGNYTKILPSKFAVQNLSYEEIARVLKEAFGDSIKTPNRTLPYGTDLKRALPGAFNGKHSLSDAGKEAFDKVFGEFGLTCADDIKKFKTVLTSLINVNKLPELSDFAIAKPEIMREVSKFL